MKHLSIYHVFELELPSPPKKKDVCEMGCCMWTLGLSLNSSDLLLCFLMRICQETNRVHLQELQNKKLLQLAPFIPD